MNKQRLLELAGIQLNENDQLVDEVAREIADDLFAALGEVSEGAINEEIDQFVHHLRQRVKYFVKQGQ